MWTCHVRNLTSTQGSYLDANIFSILDTDSLIGGGKDNDYISDMADHETGRLETPRDIQIVRRLAGSQKGITIGFPEDTWLWEDQMT